MNVDEVGLNGQGCRWRHAVVRHAGIGAIFPGALWEPVYIKKWMIEEFGYMVPMVMILSLSEKHSCYERWHRNVARACVDFGAVADHQQMINRQFNYMYRSKEA